MNRAVRHLRQALKPNGTQNLVKLFLNDSSYFEGDFVSNLVDELERKSALVDCGLEEFSLSDQLALTVLADSSYWKDAKRQMDETDIDDPDYDEDDFEYDGDTGRAFVDGTWIVISERQNQKFLNGG